MKTLRRSKLNSQCKSLISRMEKQTPLPKEVLKILKKTNKINKLIKEKAVFGLNFRIQFLHMPQICLDQVKAKK